MVLRMQKAHKLTKSDAVFHEVIPGMKRLLKGFGFFFEASSKNMVLSPS